MKRILNVFMILLISFIPFVSTACSSQHLHPTLFSSVGTWWWDEDLDTNTYFKFATKNSVNEIYYYTNEFNDKTANFIKDANKKNIKVFWLTGDYNFLTNPSALHDKINKYILFQETYINSNFAGIHLDIEPHQSPDFETNRLGLITSLISLASVLKETYPSILFDYDIPFWLDDELTIRYPSNELKTLPAFAHMINIANRVFVMSYRDSANEIYNTAVEELNYSYSTGKAIVLCVETSDVGNDISFKEEGKKYLNAELNLLEEKIKLGTGVAIHNIKSWKKLNK